MRLVGGDRALFQEFLVLSDLREIRDADRADFSRVEELSKGCGRACDRCLGIGTVEVVQVDVLGPQPAQAFVALPQDRLRTAVANLLPVWPPVDAALGGDDDLVAMRPRKNAKPCWTNTGSGKA